MTLISKLLIALVLLVTGFAHAATTILVYGDSLSAAYGIGQKEGWVALLEQRLSSRRLDYTVANASISGETSSGGASRIAAALERHKPGIVIVALGANDGLRGLPLAQMRDNLAAIVRAAQAEKARVLLAGMKMPPNYGQHYARSFEQIFVEISKRHGTALVPFLLEGVAGKRALFLDDNLHPGAQAQPIILDNVWKRLEPLLK